MSNAEATAAKVLEFTGSKKKPKNKRKSGINRNRFGSVRNVNGKVYVNFSYLKEPVREPCGLVWNNENMRIVREQLDQIGIQIKAGTFRFAEVFPRSKKLDFYTKLEKERLKLNPSPKDVLFAKYAWEWFYWKAQSGTVSGRTMYGYKSYLNHYLIPFFGEHNFQWLDADHFEDFITWARQLRIKGDTVTYESLKRYFTVLRMICTKARSKFKWKNFDPFTDFEGFRDRREKKVRNNDSSSREGKEKIVPFSLAEVKVVREALSEHWKPLFDFAVSSGVRPGELIALKPEDIDWETSFLKVERAMTLDIDGHLMEGDTKNQPSDREFALTPPMLAALEAQKVIHDRLGCEYFFCTPSGTQVDLSNFREDVWIPTLKKAGVKMRAFKQARHTFATLAIASGEDLLWIASIMGHANTQMIHKHYAKFVKNATGVVNGVRMTAAFEAANGNNG